MPTKLPGLAKRRLSVGRISQVPLCLRSATAWASLCSQSASWRFASQWRLNAQLNSVANRERLFGDTRPAIKDYTTVDLALSTQRVTAGWEVSFAVKNLFNADAREPSPAGVPFVSLPNDLPLPRRTFYVTASYSL